MDHVQHIAALLKRWLEMTRSESQAIQAGDWTLLRKVQAAKAELRPSLGRAVEQWRTANPAQTASDPFRDQVTELLALEAQNGHLLAARKRRAHEKKRLLEQALFNLRRVRGSYAKPDGLVLNSYS